MFRKLRSSCSFLCWFSQACLAPLAQKVRIRAAHHRSILWRIPQYAQEWGLSDEEIQARIDEVWNQLFYGDDETERVYYPVEDDMAYILDVNNNDVRTEGMSYGMMIAVQLDKQEEFDRLWKWVKTHMYNESGRFAGYFAWHCTPDGLKIDEVPAPDGEVWFATALFFAAGRWGNGEGIFDYQAEANAILHTMLHKADDPRSGSGNMFHAENKYVLFGPSGGSALHTDPSYHMPHYYELWARWADEDNDFWAEAATASREFFKLAAHPETGLMPNYSEFDGTQALGRLRRILRCGRVAHALECRGGYVVRRRSRQIEQSSAFRRFLFGRHRNLRR